MKKETYKKIFEQFNRKILKAVENNYKQVFLEVPVFVVGYPIFNRDKATVYLKRQLELAKFQVTHITQYELYVSLVKKKEKDHKQKKESNLPTFSDDEFPTLMNLKKAANNLRNK